MDTNTLRKSIDAMTLFPADLRRAASAVAETLNDAQRDEMLGALKNMYARYVAIEEQRKEQLKKAIEDIEKWKKTQIPALHAQIEHAESEEALASIDSQFHA